MNKFLTDLLDIVLDNINDRIEAALRRFFEAGAAHQRGEGPDFDTYLKNRTEK